ncbi:MAG TPA: DUF6603 domain-containing protein [Gemmatimonadaceae bacterium]|jgi:hypothetical protein
MADTTTPTTPATPATPDDPKKKNIFSRIVGWFKSSANWVVDHFTDPAIATSIRQDMGLAPGASIPAATGTKFAQYGAGLDPDKERITETIAEITKMVPDFKALVKSFETDSSPADEILYTIMSLAATDEFRRHLPAVFAFGRLAMFIEDDPESMMVLDPAKLLRNVRGEDLPSGEALVQQISTGGALLAQLLTMFITNSKDKEKHGVLDIFAGWDAAPDTQTPKADLVSTRATTFILSSKSDLSGQLLVTLLGVPTEHGGPGLFVSLGGALDVKHSDGTMTYDLQAGFPSAFDIFIPFSSDAMDLTANGGGTNPFLKFTIQNGDATTPAFRLGEPTGTRLDVYQMEFGMSVSGQNAGIHAAFSNAELVVAGGGSGGFIDSLIGSGAKVRFNGGFTADDNGFRLDGGTNLHATLPVGRTIAGALTVQNVDIGLGPSTSGGELGLELSGGFTAKIGPVTAVLDRIGFELDIDKRADGNVGPFNLSLGFKRPNGIGLTIDAKIAKGGGYLYVDPINHEYAGALELKFGELSIKAIGLLSDAPEGWSLVVMLYGQITPPVPSPGWTLYGIGGVVGIQRGIDETKLAQAIKTKAFDDILFPDNPVADAPRIISEMRSFFPFSAGSVTVGPMFDIGYGAPRFIFIRIAIIVQVNNVLHQSAENWSLSKVVLVGQLRVELGPTKQDSSITLVKLIVDVLGFWDRDQKKYGFLATLRDSKIATIDITGGLLVLGQYGEDEQFILAAGGFNPRFKDVPPEASGAIDRLGASFKVGRFALKMTGYFAITPGTIQAGFDFQAKASIGPVGISGELGLDVIVYRDPHTHFAADFKFSAAITYDGHNLAGVSVSGSIEGPGLWHITGKVTFSILFWDIDKSFDETWGHSDDVALATTNVAALLAAEMNRPANWSTTLPTATEVMVTLAPSVGETSPVAHPFARLAFSQTVVPFGLTLDKFGDTAVAGPNRFDISGVTVGTTTNNTPNFAQEHFARAQYLDTSDEDKLTQPSFEPMTAGVEFSSTDVHLSEVSSSFDMDFEMVYLDADPVRPGVTRKDLSTFVWDHDLIKTLALQGAAARAPRRLDETMRAKVASRVSVTAAPLAVTQVGSMTPDSGVVFTSEAITTHAIAQQELSAAGRARTQLVEKFELATW